MSLEPLLSIFAESSREIQPLHRLSRWALVAQASPAIGMCRVLGRRVSDGGARTLGTETVGMGNHSTCDRRSQQSRPKGWRGQISVLGAELA